MRGEVIECEGILRIQLRGAEGIEIAADAIVDTGFTDYLCLPAGIVEALDLEFETWMLMSMADDRAENVCVFKGTIVWHGEERVIPIHQVDAPLIGMSLLRGDRLTMDVVDGGELTIVPLAAEAAQ